MNAVTSRRHINPWIMKDEKSIVKSKCLLYTIISRGRRSESFKDPFIFERQDAERGFRRGEVVEAQDFDRSFHVQPVKTSNSNGVK